MTGLARVPLAIGLRRDLGSRQIQFLAIGAAIGSGLFVGSAQALRAAGPGLLIAYAVCAPPVYLIARCLGEMTLAFPGQPTFVDQVRGQLGPRAGLICGWTFWLSLVLIGMAELTAIGLLVHGWITGAPRWLVVTASLAAPLLFNLAPVRRFGTIEVWISALKVLTIILFIGLGLLAALPGHLGLADAGLSNLWRWGLLPAGWSGLVAVLPVALFSFGGFEMVSLAASEAADPDRAVPSAVNGLIVRFVIFYLGGIAALLVLLPWTRMVPGVSPFVVVLQRLSFTPASILLDIVLISAVSSSCSALLFAASRTLRALAGAAGAPVVLAALTAQGVPRNAVLVSAAAISAAILLNGLIPREAFGLLMRMVSIATLANWSLIVLAQMASRRRTPVSLPRFAVPFSPWSNGLVLAFIATMLILMAVP